MLPANKEPERSAFGCLPFGWFARVHGIPLITAVVMNVAFAGVIHAAHNTQPPCCPYKTVYPGLVNHCIIVKPY